MRMGLLSLLFYLLPLTQAQKNIHVDVQARWNHTSLLLEAGEFYAESSQSQYLKFIDQVLSRHDSSTKQMSDKEEYELALEIAVSLGGTGVRDLLRHALALRAYSPKVQLFRSLFDDTKSAADASASVEGCTVVLAINQHLTCFSGEKSLDVQGEFKEQIFPEVDHIMGKPCGTSTPVVVYANILSKEFAKAHKEITELTNARDLCYVLRPMVVPSDTPLIVQGFGIELAIKNMEYKVIDDTKIEITDEGTDELAARLGGEDEDTEINGFYFKRLAERYPEASADLGKLKEQLLATAEEKSSEINVWDLKDLGIQTAQSVLRSKDPLALMRDVSQNFPMFTPALVRVKVASKVKNNFKKHSRANLGFGQEENFLSINGHKIDVDSINPFEIYKFLKSEILLASALKELNLSQDTVRRFAKISAGRSSSESERLKMGYNTKFGQKLFAWLNNLEKDKQYVSWERGVSEFLNPGWPNQLRYIRQNLYSTVLVIDPASPEGLSLWKNAAFFVERNAPIRLSVLFVVPSKGGGSEVAKAAPDASGLSVGEVPEFKALLTKVGGGGQGGDTKDENDSASALIAKAFYLLWDDYSTEVAFDFLGQLANSKATKTLKAKKVKKIFSKVLSSQGDGDESNDQWKKVRTGSELAKLLANCQNYLRAKGLDANTKKPIMVMNGKKFHIDMDDDDDFRMKMMNGIFSDQHHLMQMTQSGKVTAKTKFPKYFDSLPEAQPSFGKHVTSDDVATMSDLVALPKWFKYFGKEGNNKVTTYWCVFNPATADGLSLAAVTLKHALNNAKPTRVAFVLNPSKTKDFTYLESVLVSAIEGLLSSKAVVLLQEALQVAELFGAGTSAESESLKAALELLVAHSKTSKKFKGLLEDGERTVSRTVAKHAAFVSELAIVRGENRLVANGRIIEFPKGHSKPQVGDDLILADHYSITAQSVSKLQEVLQSVSFPGVDPDDITSDFIDDLVLKVIAIRKATGEGGAASSSEPIFDELSKKDIGVIRHGAEDSVLQVKAVLDPLSKAAQVVTPFLISLRDSFDLGLTLVLNPKLATQQPPLKRYYRSSSQDNPFLTFGDDGSLTSPGVGAMFKALRTDNVLTMGITTPETWQVAASSAKYDLDNIRLPDVAVDTMNVVYKLKHLLMPGRCHDVTNDDAPAGLQLELSSPSTGNIVADTLVMANLGYFQLQANPGVWQLSLHGPANTVFEFEGKDLPTRLITSFDDPTTSLIVKRREGQEDTKLEDLTMEKGEEEEDEKESGGMLNYLMSTFSQKKPKKTRKRPSNETIHVFSIASGHLYERFLKIMMMSVLENTESPVKFWFIENFFSPQFKDFVAAHKHMFDVEFVTYKWPLWLRRQTEKQRIIWGYKILFLDVLFPLDVPRIIYIDADQVVRGDVKELWDMDLQGAPYAYTPFCDSNTETEGFRFWKQGYWKNHLRGRPYHISALYVVDLHKFRRQRTGDTLRSVYDNLSADPNSLSNLDQDLPNYAQDMVPIHSLPQEWLWCQAWCSMDSLSAAKTIDLCNNPLTKRPKLEVARELLPEWSVFDDKAKALEDAHLAKRKPSHSEL